MAAIALIACKKSIFPEFGFISNDCFVVKKSGFNSPYKISCTLLQKGDFLFSSVFKIFKISNYLDAI